MQQQWSGRVVFLLRLRIRVGFDLGDRPDAAPLAPAQEANKAAAASQIKPSQNPAGVFFSDCARVANTI